MPGELTDESQNPMSRSNVILLHSGSKHGFDREGTFRPLLPQGPSAQTLEAPYPQVKSASRATVAGRRAPAAERGEVHDSGAVTGTSSSPVLVIPVMQLHVSSLEQRLICLSPGLCSASQAFLSDSETCSAPPSEHCVGTWNQNTGS